MSNSHHSRILTALILVPLLAFVVFFNNRFLLSAFFLLISITAIREFYSFFWNSFEKKFFKLAGAILAGLLFCFATFKRFDLLLLGNLFVFWTCLLLFLYSYAQSPDKTSWADTQVLLSALIYIPFFLQFVLFLDPYEIAFVLLATTATDTGAFYTGKHLGKKKIWPAISPKKTWMGCFGGMLACILVASIWGSLLGSINWWHWLWIGFILNLAAQAGDFFQSALKRYCQIKDSGTLLPGHGGVLDRIDSLLLALPVYFGLHIIYSPF